jgi:hypothetical protein
MMDVLSRGGGEMFRFPGMTVILTNFVLFGGDLEGDS